MKKFKEHIKSDIAKYKDLLSNPDKHKAEFIDMIHHWDDLNRDLGNMHDNLKDLVSYGVGDTDEEEAERQEAISDVREVIKDTEARLDSLEKDFLDKFKTVLDSPHSNYTTLGSIARKFDPAQAFRYFFLRGQR